MLFLVCVPNIPCYLPCSPPTFYIGLHISGELPPPDVKKHFLEKFSERSPDPRRKDGKHVQRRLSNKMKDKVLLHLLVLTLILDDFRVDCSTLQQDLKVTTRK